LINSACPAPALKDQIAFNQLAVDFKKASSHLLSDWVIVRDMYAPASMSQLPRGGRPRNDWLPANKHPTVSDQENRRGKTSPRMKLRQ